MSIRLFSIFLISLVFLTGCASPMMRNTGLNKLFPRKAEQALSVGINDYENGDYPAAAISLQNALDDKLIFQADQVRAHKYLAFIDCSSGRKWQCKDEFKKALAIDPAFELAPAEAGHPIWGPIFRSLKNEQGTVKTQ